MANERAEGSGRGLVGSQGNNSVLTETVVEQNHGQLMSSTEHNKKAIGEEVAGGHS